jgi:hypothetical protein
LKAVAKGVVSILIEIFGEDILKEKEEKNKSGKEVLMKKGETEVIEKSMYFFCFKLYCIDIPLRLVEGSNKSLFNLTPNSINFNSGNKYVSVFLDKKIEKVFY